ncbi:MAG: hypothetical protein ACLSB9_20675 [Hydrogeniiclostridium mannosilyticum]
MVGPPAAVRPFLNCLTHIYDLTAGQINRYDLEPVNAKTSNTPTLRRLHHALVTVACDRLV